jgi:branched-subunit amino acid aminotransferase/4-amino-4-deoxychorismate lyase
VTWRRLFPEARQRRLTLTDLRAASRVWITSALRGAQPVASLDGAPLAERSPPTVASGR